MDALDEFFRVWCEPEAWCERCGVSPAIHVLIHDQDATYGSIVTYVRIWDPGAQAHLAMCRKCSTHHIDSLGRPEFRYAPQQQVSKESRQQQIDAQGVNGCCLRHWGRRTLTFLRALWQRHSPHRAVDTASSPSTQT
jgi:hypothetical protein